jgi:hypothetical protein
MRKIAGYGAVRCAELFSASHLTRLAPLFCPMSITSDVKVSPYYGDLLAFIQFYVNVTG